MKILHIVSTKKLSGAERVQLDILKNLSSECEVVYASPDGDVRRDVESEGVRFLAFDPEQPKNIKKIYDEEQPDVVHACDPRMSYKCARAGIPFIAHLHCNCPWMKKYSPNSFALYYAIKKANAVIAVSDSIVDDYVFGKKFKDKISVIPNVVDRERVTSLARAPFDGRYDLVFVGRLSELKRPLVFLEVVRRLTVRMPGIRAAMIGDGELREEVENTIDKCQIKNVDLLGYDPNPYRIMARSRLNVMTSSNEGYGLVAVEGMTLGVPVVAFPSGGITQIAKRGGALCSDVDEMTDTLYRLLTNDAEYEKLSAAALAASYSYTDVGAYMERIKELYRLAAKKRS